jgi:hypothetical protein
MSKERFLIAAIFAATSIESATDEHPNKLKFKGILVQLDSASTKAPNGSRGHKILIPKSLAEKRYKTLIGMGVNYHSDLDKHNPTKKVGVINKAWIEGSAIHVSGVIWKKDFPDAEKDLKQANLGMSFEASDIDVEDPNADIWRISDLCFTGAAILYKASAAYYKTEALAASAMLVELITKNKGGDTMAKPDVKKGKKTSVAASGEGLSVETLVAAMTAANKPIIDSINALTVSNANLQSTILQAQAAEVEAKGKKAMKKDEDDGDDDDEDDGDDDDDEEAAADMDEEAAGADDADELEDLDDEDDEDENEKPGHINKDVGKFSEKGDKTTVSTKGDKHKSVKAGADLSNLRKTVDELVAAREADQNTIKKLNKQLKVQGKQIEAAADRQDRRSVNLSAGAMNLLTKNGVDPNSMSASGEKMTIAEFDACAKKADLSIGQRTAFKTELSRAGIMEDGVVTRQSVN